MHLQSNKKEINTGSLYQHSVVLLELIYQPKAETIDKSFCNIKKQKSILNNVLLVSTINQSMCRLRSELINKKLN